MSEVKSSAKRFAPEVIKKRAEAAVLGSFLADSATVALHWIYDTVKLKGIVGDKQPEFTETHSCPFYKEVAGGQTCYGHEEHVYLRVGASTGAFAPEKIEEEYFNTYKDDGDAKKGGWYFNHGTKEFLANKLAGKKWPECGGADNQANALAHAVPVVALYAGDTAKLLSEVAITTRVIQNNAQAVAFAQAGARLLEKLIVSDIGAREAVQQVIAELRDAKRISATEHDGGLADGLEKALSEEKSKLTNAEFVKEIGLSCAYPFGLWSGAHLISSVDSSQAAYISAVRQTILGGGDNGSRNTFVGALQGARLGSADQLPGDWTKKSVHFAALSKLAAQLVAHRKD